MNIATPADDLPDPEDPGRSLLEMVRRLSPEEKRALADRIDAADGLTAYGVTDAIRHLALLDEAEAEPPFDDL